MVKKMWSDSIFENEFQIITYDKGQFPFSNMFTSNSFYSMMDSSTMKKQNRELTEAFIRSRQEYIHSTCNCAALCDLTDDESVFAYFFWNELHNDIGPVIYFAYVKRSFRKKGAMTFLIKKVLGEEYINDMTISYPFQIKKEFLDRYRKTPFFI